MSADPGQVTKGAHKNVDGLQAIQNRILKEAEATAAEILEQARAAEAETARQTEIQVAALRAEALGRADAQADAIKNRAASTAAMDGRRQELLTRQQLIDQVIAAASQQLNAMPDQDKLALYVRMVTALQADGGEITLSEKDSRLGPALVKQLGESFTLAAQFGHFDGGVILRRDRIEDNLTFDLMIRHERPRLSALAAQALFEGSPSAFQNQSVLPDIDQAGPDASNAGAEET